MKYKQKTRKGAAARFKITGTGKVMRRSQNRRHLQRKKSQSAKRAGRVPQVVPAVYAKKIKRMLGLA